jgi:alpha,alpha-trehalase
MVILNKAKTIAKKTKSLLSFRPDIELTSADVEQARTYIKDFWPNLERFHPTDDESLVGLPKPYLVPSYDEDASFDYNELYYWDSYFMIQGMLDNEHQELVMGVLDDLISLRERFKVIPNGSRTFLMGRSQPPLLTTFIFDVYQAYGMDKDWLKNAIEQAKQEYEVVWMGTKKPNDRLVHLGLSRYYDINYLHDLAEAESGWDMTTRFSHKCLNYVPIDLNSLLYKYETDFAKAAHILGNVREAGLWEDKAEQRKKTVNKLMWDRARGQFFDYNYVKTKRGTVSSLASYYPMWAGMASEAQAEALVKSLKRFERKGGLSTTDAVQIGQMVMGGMPTQWAYPNGWAPLHFLVIKGLERYGYHREARRIAIKWLKTNLAWFNEHGVFLEKYNVVDPKKPPLKGVYPSQTGFGWTNAIFERLCQEYVDRAE